MLDIGSALRAAQLADPASIPDVLLRAAGGLGATDVVVYLVDFGQTTLEPLPDRSVHSDLPQTEDVGASMAGRAFADQCAVTAERPGGTRVWVPVVEGSDRTGVLAVTVEVASAEVVGACEELGLLAGYLIAAQARATDLYNLHRRRRSMSLEASMQWDLLPPLVLKTRRLAVACLLEPAYDVGGDCFDYSMNDVVFDLAVVDAMGHGVSSALMAALTLGSYRHDRREGLSLEVMHANLEAVMGRHFPELAFATGQLARIDLGSGEMTWINAGHPLPLLVRGGRVIGELECPPAFPWGLGLLTRGGAEAEVATCHLEPGDSLVFYTDGMIEAHRPGGEPFGVDRLADLIGQHASDQLEPEEIVRRLVRSLVEHQEHRLADDATVVLVQWHGPGERP